MDFGNPFQRSSGPSNPLGRVLVIDDIEEMRLTLRRMFKRAGAAEVTMAGSIDQGREALESARTKSRPFDLVFIDQLMPDGNGVDLIEEIVARGLVDRRHTGLFVLSGLSDAEFQLRAKASGAITLLEKPISFERLVEVGHRWLRFRANLRRPAAASATAPHPTAEEARR